MAQPQSKQESSAEKTTNRMNIRINGISHKLKDILHIKTRRSAATTPSTNNLLNLISAFHAFRPITATIFDNLDVNDAYNLSKTSKALSETFKHYIHHHKFEKWNLNKKLNYFVDDSQALRELLAVTGSIIGGFFARDFIKGIELQFPILDIYQRCCFIGHESSFRIADWLQANEGYRLATTYTFPGDSREIQIQDLPTFLRGEAANEVLLVPTDTSRRDTVIRLHRTGQNPVATILNSSGNSQLLNFITATKAYCLYPRQTLLKHELDLVNIPEHLGTDAHTQPVLLGQGQFQMVIPVMMISNPAWLLWKRFWAQNSQDRGPVASGCQAKVKPLALTGTRHLSDGLSFIIDLDTRFELNPAALRYERDLANTSWSIHKSYNLRHPSEHIDTTSAIKILTQPIFHPCLALPHACSLQELHTYSASDRFVTFMTSRAWQSWDYFLLTKLNHSLGSQIGLEHYNGPCDVECLSKLTQSLPKSILLLSERLWWEGLLHMATSGWTDDKNVWASTDSVLPSVTKGCDELVPGWFAEWKALMGMEYEKYHAEIRSEYRKERMRCFLKKGPQAGLRILRKHFFKKS